MSHNSACQILLNHSTLAADKVLLFLSAELHA